MEEVREPAVWVFRGEEYPYTHIAFRDVDTGEQFTTTESDTECFNQVADQYRRRHGIPSTEEIIALRKRHGLSAAKMSLILGFGANQYRLYEEGEVPSESNGKLIRAAMNDEVFRDLFEASEHLMKPTEYGRIRKHLMAELV